MIVIINPEVSSVRDADRVIGLVEAHQKGPAMLIVNRIDSARVKKKDMLSVEDITEILSSQVIGIVPEDEEILSSTNRGQPVVLNSKGSAAQAYRDIARRIIGESVPLTMPSTGLFWQKLFGRA